MKKILITAAILSCLSASFTSCTKSSSDVTDYTKFSYSTLTPAQQKEKLSNDANSFITSINGLTTAKSVQLLSRLNNLGIPKITTTPLTKSVGVNSLIYVKDFTGTYTWNAATGEWDKTSTTGLLTLLFPASNSATTNNGKIEATGIGSGNMSNDYELPKQLDAKMTVDGVSVGSAHFTASDINADSAPTALSLNYALENYSINMNANKGATSTSSFTLKNGNTLLLDGNVNLAGNLDSLNFDKGNIQIKIMDNLVIAGNIDIASYNTACRVAQTKYDNSPQQDADRLAYDEDCVAAFNNNSTLVLAAIGDKTKIATLKERVKSEDIDRTTVYTLTFGDKTTVDADVYFGAGFDTVLNNWTDFMNKIGL